MSPARFRALWPAGEAAKSITLGQAPAFRASRALRPIDVRNLCVRAAALARRFSLHLAILSAIIAYVGILAGSEVTSTLAAAAAIGFACITDSARKGGAE